MGGQAKIILRKYTLKNNEGTTRSGIQIIGWDPVAAGIRSWTFDSDSGFGSEQWTKDGKNWVLEATGVTRDGAQTAATNILSPIDHDHFTWQSVRRSLDQVRLNDTALDHGNSGKNQEMTPRFWECDLRCSTSSERKTI